MSPLKEQFFQPPFLRKLASQAADACPAFKRNDFLEKVISEPWNDLELYVRRSVANNLNDISKDHPDLVIRLVNKWRGTSRETDLIVKHACRSLLKQGRSDVLKLFGFSNPACISVTGLKIEPPAVKIGDCIQLSCQIKSTDKVLGKLRLEYLVHFIKANGSASPKVFQVRECTETGNRLTISKHHSFKNLSTRKHYPGSHRIEFRVNGVVKAKGTVIVQN